MKYLLQFCVILIFALIGQLLEYLIPAPIAGSIYGMVLLFSALATKIVKLEWVEDVANWMQGVMAVFFIAPAVAIIDIWADIADIWWILAGLMIVTYLVTMIITGVTADKLIERKNNEIEYKSYIKEKLEK